jgi:hypothetical protein
MTRMHEDWQTWSVKDRTSTTRSYHGWRTCQRKERRMMRRSRRGGRSSDAQREKEWYVRWPLQIHLSQAYLDTEAASAGVTDAQRADSKEWTDSCAM